MRIAIFLLALVASASLLPAVAHAGPAGQLSPPAGPATGSISGRIVVEGLPDHREIYQALGVIPADIPQPFETRPAAARFVDTDDQGNFTFSGLADGDYFLPWPIWLGTLAEPLPETVSFWVPELFAGDGTGIFTLPALRVTIANGEAVTGIEIVIRRPDLVVPPITGAGPAHADGATDRIAAGLAVAAALLLVGGFALRARGRRLL